MALNGDLGRLLLDLYRLTRQTPPLGFQEAALRLVERRLPFDSALWGTFSPTPGGAHVHSVYLFKQPERMMRDYERMKQHDWVHRLVMGRLGHTFNVELRRSERTAHPDAVAHARRYGMEQTLATVAHERTLNLYTAISFYRKDPARRFSEPERRLKQELVPHLIETWHLNAIHLLDGVSQLERPTPRARARVDGRGLLHNAEPGFTDLLLVEFPDWEGPTIPRPLLALLAPESSPYKGRRVVVSSSRRLPDGTHIVNARRVSAVDALTARELAVAREFASGKTHREIAAALGSSPETVRTQLRSAYAKLGVSSKVELGRILDWGE